ncbi:MAG TPA: UDP-N-acetylmuramate--L-alanine ligase [Gammaproteobacteria bacterium]|nr:UDP-N-acetylmuramate--L-alanine ligase [Gammaproteobacteria bacterium]
MTTSLLENVRHIHFVGIGGAGMGGIAEVLLHQGYIISGSDMGKNAMVQRLSGLGAKIFPEHKAQNILGAEIVVVSTAIAEDNPEVIAARLANIPVIARAQMLAELMHSKYGIAIAGTHGKTTTTSLVASILTEGGLDPTFVIGGLLKSAGANAHLGTSEYFVAEADESDASFLFLHPKITIVTNVDADHLGTYGGDFECLCDTFIRFLHQLPEDGLAIVCIDDPVIRELLPRITRPVVTYGFDSAAEIRITDFDPQGFQTHFKVRDTHHGEEVVVSLNLPGAHNVLNATAAIAVAFRLGISGEAVARALQKFAGVGRRMQIYGELPVGKGGVLVIDDYGHHPREIAATWAAIRQAWPERRLVVVYQPHRYTRTRDLFTDFVSVLTKEVDKLILLDVYSAGETPISGADGAALFLAIQSHTEGEPVFVPHMDDLPEVLARELRAGDVLLTQGAGSVGGVAPKLMAKEFQLVA